MVSHILYRSDFADPQFFDHICERHGIATTEIVQGIIMKKPVESITLWSTSCDAEYVDMGDTEDQN